MGPHALPARGCTQSKQDGPTSEEAGEPAKRAAPNQAIKSRKKRRGYVAREASEAVDPCLEEKWGAGAQLLGSGFPAARTVPRRPAAGAEPAPEASPLHRRLGSRRSSNPWKPGRPARMKERSRLVGRASPASPYRNARPRHSSTASTSPVARPGHTHAQ